LDGVNTSGYYWSSSPVSDVFGFYMSFNSTTVFPAGSNFFDRRNSFAVRCVAE
jgi:hypothetical protein